MSAPTAKWLRMAKYYRRFAADWPQADFSDAAAREAYAAETYGAPVTRPWNGFVLGKKWMDVTVAGWKEELAKRNLWVHELARDGFDEAFLRQVGVLE